LLTHIWLSNASKSVSCERIFFVRLCSNLKHRYGVGPASERFPGLTTLAALPWLDQPRCLPRTPLLSEIYDAWDCLWTLRLSETVLGLEEEEAAVFSKRPAQLTDAARDGIFGRYLARPLHELAGFVARAPSNGTVRAATHRKLIVGPEPIRGWRIIHGGRASKRYRDREERDVLDDAAGGWGFEE
jgi:hypothetical protein